MTIMMTMIIVVVVVVCTRARRLYKCSLHILYARVHADLWHMPVWTVRARAEDAGNHVNRWIDGCTRNRWCVCVLSA